MFIFVFVRLIILNNLTMYNIGRKTLTGHWRENKVQDMNIYKLQIEIEERKTSIYNSRLIKFGISGAILCYCLCFWTESRKSCNSIPFVKRWKKTIQYWIKIDSVWVFIEIINWRYFLKVQKLYHLSSHLNE